MITRLFQAIKSCRIVRLLLENRNPASGCDMNVPEHPWQDDLNHLATKLGENPVQMKTEIVSEKLDPVNEEAQEVEEEFNKLFKQVKDELEDTDPPKGKTTLKKRKGDTTSVDLQAWWGNSVATWDPIDSKNVDHINQQPRRRKTKWFDA